MQKELTDTLVDFYKKILEPEFCALRNKQLEHDDKFLEMLGHFDSLYKRLDRLEDEYFTIVQGMKRIEEVLVDATTQRDVFEKRIQAMKDQIKIFQNRLEEMEKTFQRSGKTI